MLPAGFEAFGFCAHLGSRLLAEQVERQVAQNGQILVGVALTDAALILAKGDIQHPVQAVLNPPVPADRRAEARKMALRPCSAAPTVPRRSDSVDPDGATDGGVPGRPEPVHGRRLDA